MHRYLMSTACVVGCLWLLAVPATAQEARAVECHPRGGLPNFYARIEAGEDVRIAFLGGSITAQDGWRVLLLKQFQAQYPRAGVREIFAAVSGTGSDLAVHRLQRDVLQHRPDLLFVEFAVNDGGQGPQRIRQAMEGIVRQTWKRNPHTDICFVYTLSQTALPLLQSGKYQSSATAMEQVAEHYGIPSIHLGVEVARLAQAGKLIFTGKQPANETERAALAGKVLFSGDGVHPYPDTGHPLYAAAIERSLPALRQAGKAGPHSLPAPLDPENWEQARLAPFPAVQHSGGWQQLTPTAAPVRDARGNSPAAGPLVPALWMAAEPGEFLAFRFRGTAFGIYGVKGPDVGQFSITVDNRKPITATFFDSYCTENRWRLKYWLYPEVLPVGEHSVRVELLPGQIDKTVILKQRGAAMMDLRQFAGRNLYVGDVLVVGELLGDGDAAGNP